MHEAEERRSNRRCGPHHSVIATDVYGIVGQMVDERAVLVQASPDVVVCEVLVEELIVFFVFDEVIVDNSLLLVQVTSQLILDVHLVVLVLNQPQLLEGDSYALDHLIELRSMHNHLTVLLGLLKCYDERTQLFFRHCLHDRPDLVASLKDEVFHIRSNHLRVWSLQILHCHMLQCLDARVHVAIGLARDQRTPAIIFWHLFYFRLLRVGGCSFNWCGACAKRTSGLAECQPEL